MLVLFPSDTFETHKPDPGYAVEVEIAKEHGHEVAFIHHESLVNNDDAQAAVQGCPDLEEDTPAIYRGWMVTSKQYEQLYEALQTCGIELLTTPDQYKKAHELPGWYLEIPEMTPASAIIQKHELRMENLLDRAKELLEKCPHGILIKDYVKSRKHEWEDACFIPDMSKAEMVITNFIERQGEDLQGGVVLREFVPLKTIGLHPGSGMPMSEELRIFWVNYRPVVATEYWPAEFYKEGVEKVLDTLPDPSMLGEVAERIGSPFITMDMARKDDGEWIIIEIGDGQVSGFPDGEGDAELFYHRLDEALSFAGIDPDAPPLTQTEFDQMTCSDSSCDHTAHDRQMMIHPKCHVGTPTWCIYENGVMDIRCAECNSLVVRIAVDPGNVVIH